jgi:N-acetylglutamate synthase-like GNAT family acetyltransferase
MAFEVKKHSKEEFYEVFSKWLDLHNFNRINKEVLPENCFVVYKDDLPIYSFWVYFTDSKLMWIAFPASNKNVNYKKRIGGMEVLLEHIKQYAKRKGIITLFTTSSTESIIGSLTNCGFEIGDTNVNHLTIKL